MITNPYNNQSEQSSSMKDFQILSKLGEGAFSCVYKVKRISDKQIYALKKVKMNMLSAKEKQNSLNEVRILASINDPYIVQYKDCFFEPTENCLCLVMEFCDGGDILQLIRNCQKQQRLVKEMDIWKYFINIIQALSTLHRMTILHRDIKCANIFLSNGIAKLGDLNVSKVAKYELVQTQTGTPYYASPEVWKDKPYDSKSDIWSLGCVIYELACLKPPFRGTNMEGLYKSILRGVYDPLPRQYSTQLSEIIQLCLKQNPKDRITSHELLNHSIIKKQISLMQLYGHQTYHNEKNDLLHTIELPKNLRYLQTKLPKAKYNEPLVNFNNISEIQPQEFSEQRLNKIEKYEPQSINKSIDNHQTKLRPISSQPNRNSVQVDSERQRQEYDPKKYMRPSSLIPQQRQVKQNNEQLSQKKKSLEVEQQNEVYRPQINEELIQKEKQLEIRKSRRESFEKKNIDQKPSYNKQQQQIEANQQKINMLKHKIEQQNDSHSKQVILQKQDQQKDYQHQQQSKLQNNSNCKVRTEKKEQSKEYKEIKVQEKNDSLIKIKEYQNLSKEKKNEILEKATNQIAENNKQYEQQQPKRQQSLEAQSYQKYLDQQFKIAQEQKNQQKIRESLNSNNEIKLSNQYYQQQQKPQPEKDVSRFQRIFSAKVKYDYNKQNDLQTQQQLLNQYKVNALNVIKEEKPNNYQYQYKKYQPRNNDLKKLQQNGENSMQQQQQQMKPVFQPKINENYLNYFINESKNLHKGPIVNVQSRLFSALPILENKQKFQEKSEIEEKIQELDIEIKKKEQLLKQRHQNRIPRQINQKERVSNDFVYQRPPLRNNQVINSLFPRIQSAQVNNRQYEYYIRQKKNPENLNNNVDQSKNFNYLQQQDGGYYLGQYKAQNEFGNKQQQQQYGNYKIQKDNRNIQSAQYNLKQRGLNVLKNFNVRQNLF